MYISIIIGVVLLFALVFAVRSLYIRKKTGGCSCCGGCGSCGGCCGCEAGKKHSS